MPKPPTLTFVILLAGIVLLAPPSLGAQTCSDCHDNKPASHTAHENVACANCHSGHEEFPHPAGAAPVTCGVCHSQEADQTALGVHGQERQRGNEAAPDCEVCHGKAHEVELPGTTRFRRATVETCGMCHSEEADQFRQSVHGALLANETTREGPICNTCHGEHSIQRPSSIEQTTGMRHIRDTCASCHGDVKLMSRFGLPTDRVLSFDASYHGLALRAGSQTVANCGSCHGIHLVLPPSDPRSTVNPARLAETCGQVPSRRRHALSDQQRAPERRQPAGARRASHRAGLSGADPADHRADVHAPLRRLDAQDAACRRGRAWRRSQPPARCTSNCACTARSASSTALLIVSFLTLVWTGFALRYPSQFWALAAGDVGRKLAGARHRPSHRRGDDDRHLGGARHHPGQPTASCASTGCNCCRAAGTLGEAVAGFAYNLGLRRSAPKISPHSYIEKIEYWAVVWGTVMMGISGVLLWADNLVLSYFPKGLLDVAGVFHYYEAVLAALAILVWHLYSVILDPSVYP